MTPDGTPDAARGATDGPGDPAPTGVTPVGRRVDAMGERALLVACRDLDEVLALDAALREAPLPGQVDLQPAERSLLVVLDGRRSRDRAAPVLAALPVPGGAGPRRTGAGAREVTLDVVYDGEDLDAVATLLGTSRDAVVAAHAERPWTAAFAGFAPGFVYLVGGALPAVRRRDTPRTAVPAGAVAVGGPYAAVYPRRSPGGWQLLGRTDAALWDPHREPPALVRPGDAVRFVPARADVRLAGPTVRRPDPRKAPEPPAEPALVVVSPGPLTLVQDLGRPGRRDVGVAPGGAADRAAARLANRLVGNARGAALLETVLGGLALRAERDVVVALAGAAPALEVTSGGVVVRVPAGRPTALRAGDEARVPVPATGLRSYVAVRGGVAAAAELGSRAADVLGGLGPAPLAAGDALATADDVAGAVGDAEPWDPPPGGTVMLRTVPGPDAGLPGADAVHARPWTVSDRLDRTGLRLVGEPLALDDAAGRASAGLVPGAVQVPPSGEPVVFLVDHPVTGGYPVVAVVVDADLDALAQLRPGQAVRLAVGSGDDGAPPGPAAVDSAAVPGDAGPARSSPRPA